MQQRAKLYRDRPHHRDEADAVRIARRIRAGRVDVKGARFNTSARLRGFKQPGRGHGLIRYGLEAFRECKSI